jgi:hypothetical protein
MEFRVPEPESLIDQGLLCGLQLPGVCWTEALLGCPVRMETGGAWAERFLLDRSDVTHLLDRGNDPANDLWIAAFRRSVRNLAEQAAGRFPLVQPLMRGPLDMMASALGHEQTVELFVDEPDLAERLLDMCADLFIDLAGEFLSLAPRFVEGGVTFGLWTAGHPVRTQLDNAVLLSPNLYARRCLPHDRRVFESFDPVVLHVHSGCLHIVDYLLGEESLDAIQVSIDHPGGPLTAEILPVLRRIAERKPLIVTGPATAAEHDQLLSLPPGGVSLDLQLIADG